jgi:hypothetical protein
VCEVEDTDLTTVMLMVEGCTCTKQTFWTEDQFVLTTSVGIWDRDTRVAEIVTRE